MCLSLGESCWGVKYDNDSNNNSHVDVCPKIRAGFLSSGNGHCLLHSDTQVNWKVEGIATWW